MDTIELEPETRSLLDRIRHRSEVLSIYDMPSDLARAEGRRSYSIVGWNESVFAQISYPIAVT